MKIVIFSYFCDTLREWFDGTTETDKLESLQQLEQTRQETNLSVDELKKQSLDLYQTDQIRDLSIQQIQKLQHQLGNGN